MMSDGSDMGNIGRRTTLGRSGLHGDSLLGVFLGRPFGKDERGKIEKTGGAQLVEGGQLTQALEAKMHEKAWSSHPNERPPGTDAPTPGADPAGLHNVSIVPLPRATPRICSISARVTGW